MSRLERVDLVEATFAKSYHAFAKPVLHMPKKNGWGKSKNALLVNGGMWQGMTINLTYEDALRKQMPGEGKLNWRLFSSVLAS